MPIVHYEIKDAGDGWSIHHDEDVSLAYAAREAALEAAAGEATNDLRLGYGVVIVADPPTLADPSRGTA